MRIHVDHRGQGTHYALEHVVADDDEGDAGGGEVLLCAAVDHGVLRDVDGTAQDVGAHVGDQGHGRVKVGLVFGTVDGVVAADIEVVDIRRYVKALGDVCEVAILRRSYDLHLAVILCLLDGLLAPYAGIDISGLGLEEIGRDVEELGAGAAADKIYAVVVGDVEQLLEQALGLLQYALELLCAVRYGEQRQSRSVEIDNGFCRGLKRHVGQDRGSRIEIVLLHTVEMFL